jgi:hypothetical protein
LKRNIRRWSLFEWIGHVAAAATIVSICIALISWGANYWSNRDRNFGPTIETTGRLGISIYQNGSLVGLHDPHRDDPKSWHYQYGVDLQKQSFVMRMPRRYCDNSRDIIDYGLKIRFVDPAVTQKMLNVFSAKSINEALGSPFTMAQSNQYVRSLLDLVFPGLSIYRGPVFSHTEFFYSDNSDAWNPVKSEGFQSIGDLYVEVRISSITNSNNGLDAILSGDVVDMVVATRAAYCNERWAQPVDVIRILSR